MDSILRRVVQLGLRRGTTGAQSWLVIAFIAIGIRTLRKMSRSGPDVLYRTEVQPGDRFEIGSRRA